MENISLHNINLDHNLNKAVDIIVNTIDPDKIILFGSKARGDDNNDSDYDLLILKNGIKDKRQIVNKIYRNLLGLHIAVDIILENYKDYLKNKDNKFLIYKTIEREGRTVYERE